MAPVMARGEVARVGTGRQGEARPARLSTTLYDLSTAIQDVVGPEDDALVVATVVHLLRSGRLTVHRTTRALQCEARCQEMQARPRLSP